MTQYTPSEIAVKILSASRNTLCLHMRYLDLALHALDYRQEEGNGYVGCDGAHIYYSARHLMQRYERTPVLVNRLYYHMLLHCLFRHIWKRGERDHRLWNLACDLAAEALVDESPLACLSMRLPGFRSQVYGELHGAMKVVTAEKAYEWMTREDFQGMELARLEAEFLVDDHSFWYREEKQPRQQILSQSWKDLSEKTQTSMETFSRGQGTESGGMYASLEYENRERYDYRAFLRKFAVFREEMELDMDTFDVTFYTLGLSLYGNMPLIEPLEQKEVKRIQDFVIAVDTSLSCSEELVRDFLLETCQVLQSTESFFKEVHIHIIQCDCQVRKVDELRGSEDLEEYIQNLEIVGRGGTDFRPVFLHVEKMREEGMFANLRGLIYFTDGLGTFPSRPPDYDAAFVFLEKMGRQVPVPPWAIRLVIEEAEIQRLAETD